MASSGKSIVGQIGDMITPIAERNGAYVIEIELRAEGGGTSVEIYLDADDGITTASCAAVSRELSALLETENIIQGSYELVVSSPGVERPLKFPRQYRKHLGRSLKISSRAGGSPGNIEGVLSSVGEEGIELTLEHKATKSEIVAEIVAVRFDDIIESRVKPPW